MVRWNSHQASGKGQRLWIFSQPLRGILLQIQKCNSFSYAGIRNDLLDNEFLKFSWKEGRDTFKKLKLCEGLFATLCYLKPSGVCFVSDYDLYKNSCLVPKFSLLFYFPPLTFLFFFFFNIGQWNSALFFFKSRSFQKKKKEKKSIIRIADDVLANMGVETVSSLIYEDLDGLVHSAGRVLA